jgi:hypothetical protein
LRKGFERIAHPHLQEHLNRMTPVTIRRETTQSMLAARENQAI